MILDKSVNLYAHSNHRLFKASPFYLTQAFNKIHYAMALSEIYVTIVLLVE
jgi:hypothetical protein